MPGYNLNRWTPYKVARMVELRAARVPWDEIASEIGHPVTSCRTRMTQENNARRREEAKAVRKDLREAADRRVKPAPLPITLKAADPEYARSSISTAKLVMDAELRSRIEVMGITGGLLGDPLPGRSALDRRKQAAP